MPAWSNARYALNPIFLHGGKCTKYYSPRKCESVLELPLHPPTSSSSKIQVPMKRFNGILERDTILYVKTGYLASISISQSKYFRISLILGSGPVNISSSKIQVPIKRSVKYIIPYIKTEYLISIPASQSKYFQISPNLNIGTRLDISTFSLIKKSV